MKPFGAFRLLAEPHAMTQGFVLFKMDRNVFSVLRCVHGNTDCTYTGWSKNRIKSSQWH